MMFSISFRRTLWFCDKIITRDLRSRRLGPANPGLDHRIGAFKKEGLRIQGEDAEEFVEQSASDFTNVSEQYNKLLNETKVGKHELRHHIVKDKYFKENMPNLLTWSEKEQIRHLVTTNPHEWTPERIAESFPVTVPVVKKLLKYPWKPATEERIARHDASAMRNWRELKEGSLNIPEELRQNFLKFSDRKIPPLKRESIKTDISPEKIGEFEAIIKKYATKEQPEKFHEDSQFESSSSTYDRKDVKKDKTRTTLDELTAKIKNRLKKGNEIDVPDKMILDYSVNTQNSDMSNEIQLTEDISDTQKLPAVKSDDKNVIRVNEYPERIRIPKKAYRRGATYKVNDCFYDHDGKFLYRVIGLDN